MRWIDRGPEPPAVLGQARLFTQGWVTYFPPGRGSVGSRPVDHGWGSFTYVLGSRSRGVCWYCERLCDLDYKYLAPTVDHFCPLSRCPELSYSWSNWVYSCDSCNGEFKKDHWSESGYVDPADVDPSERPELYFDFNPATGELEPLAGLSEEGCLKARRTIDAIDLNRPGLVNTRKTATVPIVCALEEYAGEDIEGWLERLISEVGEFGGIIRMCFRRLRRSGVI